MMRHTKRTIPEWETELDIRLLNLDGFNQRDKKLMERLFTQAEFEVAAAECTIYVNRDVKPEIKVSHDGKSQTVIEKKKHYRPRIALFILFTMPAVAVFLLTMLYKTARVLLKHRFRWYIPAAILLMDLLILMIQPFAALLSGPFFLWYHAMDALHHLLAPMFAHIKYQTFHQPLNLVDANKPLFSNITLGNAPMNLYFSLPQAVVSSLFWGTLIASLKNLSWKRKATLK